MPNTRRPARGRGVDLRPVAGEHPQAHAAGRQVLHGVDQVGEVAAEPVELPDDEHVAVPQRPQATVESRPVVANAGGEVVVEVGRVVDARGPQGVALQVQRLEAVGLRECERSRSACVANDRLRHIVRRPAGAAVFSGTTPSRRPVCGEALERERRAGRSRYRRRTIHAVGRGGGLTDCPRSRDQ